MWRLSCLLVLVFNAVICTGQATVVNRQCSNPNDIKWRNKLETTMNRILDECSTSTRDDEWKHNIETNVNTLLEECSNMNDAKWKNKVEITMNSMLQSLHTLTLTVEALLTNKTLPQLPVQGTIAKDCYDILQSGETRSGIFRIKPDNCTAFDVYCDMDTDSGGWTVFQRRIDGSVDFYLDWSDYKTGFGNLDGEFWLGNDKIYSLTNQGRQYELRVDLKDFDNNTAYAEHPQFSISDEADNYRMSLGPFSGNAGGSLVHHNGMAFTTRDRDNDQYDNGNCAQYRTGAWWYIGCGYANLNGQYLPGQTNYRVVFFLSWKDNESLKHVEMKIRPVI
ncbi:fibrinogen-like protein A [Glandiceps talaboti]